MECTGHAERTCVGTKPAPHVEDPTIAQLFRDKLEELDRRVAMLVHRNRPAFLLGSLQIYGALDDAVVRAAHRVLYRLPARPAVRQGARVSGAQLAALARDDIAAYRAQCEAFDASVELSDEIVSGIMVSRGRLLVAPGWCAPPDRARALLAHEVATHLLTWVNGCAQELSAFRFGLAGYEPVHEGLAVLAEYLVGGLSSERLRVLAGRVLACEALLGGASFVDTFRLLHRELGFAARTAFYMTVRAHRGGGLTKDAMYLHGLAQLLRYLAGGGELERLYVGKVSIDHLGVLEELGVRRLLRAPRALPRFLADPEARARLDGVRKLASVVDLAEQEPL